MRGVLGLPALSATEVRALLTCVADDSDVLAY